jgi:transitional endoplasmic reticulum ATPase
MDMAEKKEKEGPRLKVAEALQSDVGRGIVRIDTDTREKLGLTSGDIIKIKGKKETAGIVWQAHPQDEGRDLIRMDGLVRQNANVSIGDHVTVEKFEPKRCDKLVLAPTQAVRYSPGFEDYVRKRLIGRPVAKGDRIVVGVFGTALILLVVNTSPKGIVQVQEDTDFQLKEEPTKELEGVPQVTYEDVGGLKDEVQKVREMIEIPLKHPELFDRLGIDPPKGVLLHGPPGTGKTLLAQAVANESDANFVSIQGPEIMSKFVGEAEERLRKLFEDAEKDAPTIIFIDEIDAIAPKREEVVGEVERRVVAQILTLMDGLKSRGEVVVIGATNRPNALDPALRRPGRFDREIELGVPDKQGRKEILQIHTRNMPLTKDVDLNRLADLTHGFVGADIAALAKEAAMKTLRRVIPKINLEDEGALPAEVLENLIVTRDDFMDALKEIQPSALREVLIEVPNVKWNDVGGLEKVKNELKEAVEWPLKYPESFKNMGIRAPRGIFLYGPPGTGKTMLAKAVANESEANFISVKGPEIFSKWVGESEKAIREIFRKGRQASPVVIFLDEVDAIAPRRGSVMGGAHVTETIVNQLLTEMDGIEEMKDVVVIAATNRPDMVDPGLMRPGRFDRLILVPAPDKGSRLAIFKVHTKNVPLDRGVNIKELAERTEGYSGADIEGLVREAAMNALRKNKKSKKVIAEDFEAAFKTIKPSIEKHDLKRFKEFAEEYSDKEVSSYIG